MALFTNIVILIAFPSSFEGEFPEIKLSNINHRISKKILDILNNEIHLFTSF